MPTLTIKNAKLIDRQAPVNIQIKNNKIVSIGPYKKAPPQRNPARSGTQTEIDAKGNYVLPGLIDLHVHFREPGLTHKEDIQSGTRAAVAGGVTTVFDMPNTQPPTTTLKLRNDKIRQGKKAIVNYIPYLAATDDNVPEVIKAPKNVPVKAYLDQTTGSLRLNFSNLLAVLKNRPLTMVHAEEESLEKAVYLAKKTKNKLYLCHISSHQEMEFLKKEKIKGKIFVEVAPHHLFLNSVDVKDAFRICKPLIKSAIHQKALWQALHSGLIDVVGSDHAPHTISEKKSQKPPYGLPGVETTLPLLLNAVNQKKLTLKKVVELCCENPAKIANLKKKGYIKKGYDADLVIVDMNKKKKVENKNLKTKCGWSPYEGWVLKGWPVMSVCKGKIVWQS